MEKNHTKWKTIGRVLLLVVLFYLFVLPFIAMFVADLTCGKDPSEFCGLWIIAVSPQLLLFLGSDSFISLSQQMIVGLVTGSALFVLLFRFLLQRFAKKVLSFSWSLLFFALVTVIALLIANSILYPIPSDDWKAWSEKAVQESNPNLCLKRVDDNLQTACLSRSARLSGNKEFCVPLQENFVWNESLFDECLTDIIVTENASTQLCQSEYDFNCLETYCNRITPEYTCSLFDYYENISYFIDQIAKEASDVSLCDLYKGVVNEKTRIEQCQKTVVSK